MSRHTPIEPGETGVRPTVAVVDLAPQDIAAFNDSQQVEGFSFRILTDEWDVLLNNSRTKITGIAYQRAFNLLLSEQVSSGQPAVAESELLDSMTHKEYLGRQALKKMLGRGWIQQGPQEESFVLSRSLHLSDGRIDGERLLKHLANRERYIAADFNDRATINFEPRGYMSSTRNYELLNGLAEETKLKNDIDDGNQAQRLLRICPDQFSPSEKRVLNSAIAAGEAARNRFLTANLRLVISIAQGYEAIAGSLTIDDLIQEGNLGMMHGLKKFEPIRGNKFSTYATPWVHQAIHRAITAARPVHVPEHLKRPHALIMMYEDSYLLEHSKRAPTEWLAEQTGMPKSKVLEIQQAFLRTTSLETPIEAGGASVQDSYGAEDPHIEQIGEDLNQRQLLANIRDVLSEEEYKLASISGRGSIKQASKESGPNKDKVVNIRAMAMNKLRHPSFLAKAAKAGEQVPEWMASAACKDLDTKQFFTKDPQERENIKKVCDDCPVVLDCQKYSVEVKGYCGVWGGRYISFRRMISHTKARNTAAN